jgi:hypothetical protein
MPAYLAAGALGAAAGLGFAWLWLRIVPRGSNRRFWAAMAALTRDILRVDEPAALAAIYARLGALLARYVGRNLAGILVACLPMVAIVVTALPLLPERSASCSSPGYCLLLESLFFDVTEVAPAAGEPPYRISRAEPAAVNPLWPFLDDLEATFFAVFMLSTFAALLWPNPRHSLKPATTP